LSEETPKVLGRYQIQRELGRGMMGVVYRALDPDLGRLVALKTIKLAFAIPDAERAAFEKRFLAEARAAASLSHPGIVVVHDVGRDPETGTVFIALEFIEGQTLAELVSDVGPIEWRRAVEITHKLAEALAHAHSKGIVHRDIKPANIMLQTSGQPKVMDFGIAKLPASNLTAAGELFGTPSFMSPEQAGGQAVDARSDLFSLGGVLYQLLTGRRAFDAGTLPAVLMRVMKEDPQPPSQIVPDLPPALDAVIAKALAKERDERYQTGLELAHDLQNLLDGRTPDHAGAVAARMPAEATRVTAATPGLATTRLSDMLSAAAGTSVLAGPRRGPRRRTRLIAGSLVAAAALATIGFALMLFMLRASPKAAALLPIPKRAPARLEIHLEHSLRAGVLKVSVDDDVVLEEALEGQLLKKVLSFRQYKGTLRQALDVPAGERTIRLDVVGDEYSTSKRIKGNFGSGVTRELRGELKGWPSRELALWWGS
jgi:tRNA A-37 threonylcarbamoyl transferase component Bud32